MNPKQHHGQSGHSYQRHGGAGQQSNTGGASGSDQPPPATKFVAAKLPQAPLNFEDIYKDTTSSSVAGGGSESKQQKKKLKANASPEGQKANQQSHTQKQQKNTSKVSGVTSTSAVDEGQAFQKPKQRAGQQQSTQGTSAQKYQEESKTSSVVGSAQKVSEQRQDSSNPATYFQDELTPQLLHSAHNASMPKLHTQGIQQQMQQNQHNNYYQWSSQTIRESNNNRRNTAKHHQNSNKKQKGGFYADFDQPQQTLQVDVRKSEPHFTYQKPHKKQRGRVVIETSAPAAPESTETNQGDNSTSNSKQQSNSKLPQQHDSISISNTSINMSSQKPQESNKSQVQKDENDESAQDSKSKAREDVTPKKKPEEQLSKVEDESNSQITPQKQLSKKQDFGISEVKILEKEDAVPSINASASKANTRQRDTGSSPLGQQQNQLHSQRSSSEVVQKKVRKAPTSSGVMVPTVAGKSKKQFDKQEKQKMTEIANNLRNNAFAGKNQDSDRYLKVSKDRNSSGSLKESLGEGRGDLSGKRKRVQRGTISSSNQIEDRDKLSDDMNITPNKNLQTEPNLDEKVEEPVNKNQLKRHYVDLDAKNGGRELLVISITVKNRIIEATVRQNTDLSKLYDRISLLGDFGSYPHKFKDIFFRYWKNLIDDAEKLLKEEEQLEKAKKGSSKQSEDRSMKIQSSSSKKDKQVEKPTPTIQVSGLAQPEILQPSSTKSLDQNLGDSLQRFKSPQTTQFADQSNLFQQSNPYANQYPTMQPPYMQGLNPSLAPLNPSNIEALLQQNLKINNYGPPQNQGFIPQDQLLQLMLQHQQNQLFPHGQQSQSFYPNGQMPSPISGQSPPFHPALGAQGAQQNPPLTTNNISSTRWEDVEQANNGAGQERSAKSHQKSGRNNNTSHNLPVSSDNDQDGQKDKGSRREEAGEHGEAEDGDGSQKRQREQQQVNSNSGFIPSNKDEQIIGKGHGHKNKKIKQVKVIEYSAANKKGSFKEHPQQYNHQRHQSHIQQSNVPIQILSQSSLADPHGHMMSSSEQFLGGQQESTLGQTASGPDGAANPVEHSDVPNNEPREAANHSNIAEAGSSAQIAGHQGQRDRKKNKKTASQRKKEEYPMILSPVDSHSAANYAQNDPNNNSLALPSKKQSNEGIMLSETVKVEDAFTQSMIQSTDQNVSSFLKVGVDQESIKTVTSGAGSDIQQQLNHAMQQQQQQQQPLDPLLQQYRIPQVNKVNFDGMNQIQATGANNGNANSFQGANGQSNAGASNSTNLFVGQGLLNNSLQQVGPNPSQGGGNQQLMNFTFNNFNNHTMAGGLQTQGNQQMLANQLTAQPKSQFPQICISPTYGNTTGNFVSHINNIGTISMNVNNFNIKLNNGQQMNAIPQLAAPNTHHQFINDVTGGQYQPGGLSQPMAAGQGSAPFQGTPSQQQPQDQVVGQQQQQPTHVNAAQSPNHQQLMATQQMVQASQMQSQHSGPQTTNPFLQQSQMNNGGNFFQSMPGPQGQQPMSMMGTGQSGGNHNAAAAGSNLQMNGGSSNQQQTQQLLSQTAQPQNVAPGQQTTTNQVPPHMNQHHSGGPNQIQAVMVGQQQVAQPSFQLTPLQQPISQAVNQAATGIESGVRSQGGVTPANQKGGAAVGSKLAAQMPQIGQQQVNPLNLLMGINPAANAHNSLTPVQSLNYQQALQLLGQPYQHQPQGPIPMGSDASGAHGLPTSLPTNGQTTQVTNGLPSIPKVMGIPAYNMGGTLPALQQAHLAGLINQVGQANVNNIQNKQIAGISSGPLIPGSTQQQANSGVTTRGAPSAAPVTMASAQAQQTQPIGIINPPQVMAKDGTSTTIKQGAVAAVVIGGKNSGQNNNNSNRDHNMGNTYPHNMGQMRADNGPYLMGTSSQTQQSSNNQVVGGAHVNQQQTTLPTTNQQQRRNHQNHNPQNTSGIRGGEKQQTQGPTTTSQSISTPHNSGGQTITAKNSTRSNVSQNQSGSTNNKNTFQQRIQK